MTVHCVDPDRADAGRRERFLALPERVYGRDIDFFCAAPEPSVLAEIRRERFRGRQRLLLAETDEGAVARVAARVSPSLCDKRGQPYGMLGLFEALDRPVVVTAMLAEAIDWLRSEGAGEIIGPIDGDTWHRYRLSVGPRDHAPFLMEPYNPLYYPALWERTGFEPLETYFSKSVDDVAAVAERLRPILTRCLRRGYTLRPLNVSRFVDELGLLYDLSKRIFAENFLYDEIPRDEFFALYDGVQPLVDSNLVWFAQAPDGKDAGFLFAVADYHRAVAAMRGRRDWLARLRFVLNRRRAQAVNIKSLGVVPEHRHSGLGAALMCRAYERVIAGGYRRANLCLIREGNPSGRLDGGRGTVFRRYVLYRYAGGDRHDGGRVA